MRRVLLPLGLVVLVGLVVLALLWLNRQALVPDNLIDDHCLAGPLDCTPYPT